MTIVIEVENPWCVRELVFGMKKGCFWGKRSFLRSKGGFFVVKACFLDKNLMNFEVKTCFFFGKQ